MSLIDISSQAFSLLSGQHRSDAVAGCGTLVDATNANLSYWR
jgi:hypothetical protein